MDKICGIYKITSPSGKIYIGQSRNILKRFREYKTLNNCRGQNRLYNSFLKHGVNNHIYEIIEECSINLLNEKERYWQDYYEVLNEKGLNCVLTATDLKNKVFLDYLKVINISNNTIYNSLEEAVEKENIKHSLSYMRAMLLNLKHNFTDLRYLDKKDIPVLEKPKHSRVGTKHSTDSKNKISNKKKGNNCSGKKVINTTNNVIYESAKKAFESQTEIKKYGTFRAMLSGHLKNKTNYKYYGIK